MIKPRTGRFNRIAIGAFAFLLVLIIAATLGTWITSTISARNQLSRLEDALIRNKLLVSGKLVPAGDDLEAAEMQNISRLLDYFDNGEKEDALKDWLADHGASDESRSVSSFLNSMKLHYIESWSDFPVFSYGNAYLAPGYTIALGDNQFLTDIKHAARGLDLPETEPNGDRIFGAEDGAPKTVVNFAEKAITIFGNGNESIHFDLASLARDLDRIDREAGPGDSRRNELMRTAMTLEASSPSGSLRADIFIKEITGGIWRDEVSLMHLQAFVVVTLGTPPQ